MNISEPFIKRPVGTSLLAIGLIVGAMVGLLFSYALESLRMRVHSSTQLSELTGLPVLATAPQGTAQWVLRWMKGNAECRRKSEE